MKVVRLVFSIFFVVGLGLLVGSYFTVRHTRLFLQTAVSVLGVRVESVAPRRAALIAKGIIYSPAHGDTAFTVPLFDEFLKRVDPGL